jgi:MoaA/NifB/PqqE/SkfB family radical SAM enzyme
MPSIKRFISLAKRRAGGLFSPAAISYFSNAAKHYHAARNHSGTIPFPPSVILEMTGCCNLSCITCARMYRLGETMERGHMDLDKAKTFFKNYNRYLDRLGLSGNGETLLYPSLPEFLAYCRGINSSIIFFLSSNLQHKDTPRIFKTIHRNVDTFQVSIDGTGDVYEAIRKPADYDRFLSNLEQVCSISKNRAAQIKLNMVVFNKNYLQMKDVVGVAKRFGIAEVYFAKLNPVAIDPAMNDPALYRSPAFRAALDEALSFAKANKITLRYPESLLHDDDAICYYPWNSIFITWQGFIAPCCAKPFPKIMNFGNVFESDFLECLNSPAFIEFRKGFSKGNRPAFCAGCS